MFLMAGYWLWRAWIMYSMGGGGHFHYCFVWSSEFRPTSAQHTRCEQTETAVLIFHLRLLLLKLNCTITQQHFCQHAVCLTPSIKQPSLFVCYGKWKAKTRQRGSYVPPKTHFLQFSAHVRSCSVLMHWYKSGSVRKHWLGCNSNQSLLSSILTRLIDCLVFKMVEQMSTCVSQRMELRLCFFHVSNMFKLLSWRTR